MESYTEIDWDKVQILYLDLGEQHFTSLIRDFLDDLYRLTAKLRDRPDRCALESDLQFMKTTSHKLGLVGFSLFCARQELIAAKGETSDIDLAGVLSSFDLSMVAFHEELVDRLQSYSTNSAIVSSSVMSENTNPCSSSF